MCSSDLLIWGTAFVAQSAGMDYLGPMTYNSVRMLIGALVLLPVILAFDHRGPVKTAQERRATDRVSLLGGLCCGVFLALGSTLQQMGVSMTTAGKAGFLTALYIVIVPLLGVFIGKRIPKIIWVCVAVAVGGFYLLCVKEGFSVGKGDLLVLCSALFFSLHIMVVDHWLQKGVDGVRMSCVQFLTCGLVVLVPALLFEETAAADLWGARYTLLYTGVLSSGVAYTMQILGQKYTEPATATLLLSLESVFAALSGWLILHEAMSGREVLGCVLVFAAVLLAQRPEKPQDNHLAGKGAAYEQ